MSLQFYLGRAGSGKTWRCLHDIADALRDDPSPRAGRLVWLLPEQATAQAERALLAQAGIEGYARASVLSFKRLAGLVAAERGGRRLDYLDEQGRQMLLRAMVGRLRTDLEVFGASAQQPGFIARLAGTFAELAHFRHSFDDLEAQERRLREHDEGDSLLARKMRDLARIGRAWQEATGERFADPVHFLDDLAESVGEAGILRGARVWVDGFASFMPQELRVLERVLAVARDVKVALLLDPMRLGELPAHADNVEPVRLFAQTEETYLRLIDAARNAGVELDEEVVLPEGGTPTRYSAAPLLAGVEGCLAASGLIASGGASPQAPHTGLPRGEWPALMCVSADSPRVEVEAAARAIRRLAREEGLRYRDMAVIVRDMDEVEGLLRPIFARHDIPCFIDRRRPLSHHPLVELLRSAVRVVQEDWALDDVMHYLKTDFAPVGRDEADRIENYAIAHGVRGRAWWCEAGRWRDEEGQALEEVRARAVAPLVVLDETLAGVARASGLPSASFVAALFDFLRALGGEVALRQWSGEAREGGCLEAAGEHELVWDMACDLLQRMHDTLGQERLQLEELGGVLETGLASLELGLAPPSLDQVLVGTIERSRQPELDTVFLLGVNDHAFPRSPSQDVVFSDSDRRTLHERCGLDLAPTAEVRLYRERYLGYVAMTRASRRLWVSWPKADSEGRALRPSPFIAALLEAAEQSGSAVSRWRVHQAWLAESPDAAETPRHLAEGILRSSAQTSGAAEEEGRWEDLARRGAEVAEVGRLLEQARSVAGRELFPARLGASGDFDPGEAISVSRLEKYAACPFAYFASYVLGLREREEFRVEPMDIGEYHHRVLARVFGLLRRRKGRKLDGAPEALVSRALDWGEVEAGEALEALEEALAKEPVTFLQEGPLHESQQRFYAARSRRVLRETLEGLIAQGSLDAFHQVAAELGFGFSDSSLGTFALCDAVGLAARVRGKIDRVDLAPLDSGEAVLRVVDFKSSSKGLDFGRVAAGLQLQLPVYMQALLEGAGAGILPGGMFYFPVRHRLEGGPVPEPDDETAEREVCIRMGGAFDVDVAGLFEEIEPGQAGRTINMRMTSSGKADGRGGDWLSSGAMAELLRLACDKAASLAREIGEGRIDVDPIDPGASGACSYCPYGAVCRVDRRSAGFRGIPKLTRKDLEAMACGGVEEETT